MTAFGTYKGCHLLFCEVFMPIKPFEQIICDFVDRFI